MRFPRAAAEQRSADTTDLWEERGGVSWGYLVITALRAREMYVVRLTMGCPPQPGTWVSCRRTQWPFVPTCHDAHNRAWRGDTAHVPAGR